MQQVADTSMLKKDNGRAKISRQKVRIKIQNAIINGKYTPGTRLNQSKVSKELGISVGLVREALFELKSTGLIETIDNRGVFVSKLTIPKLQELYDLREIHEGFAVRQCCGRVTPKEVENLEQLVKQMRDTAIQGDQKKASSLDREFHMKLVKLSEHKLLLQLFETHHVAGKVIWTKADPEDNYQSHMKILECIKNNQPDMAEKTMREHIRHGAELAVKNIQKDGLVFHWVDSPVG